MTYYGFTRALKALFLSLCLLASGFASAQVGNAGYAGTRYPIVLVHGYLGSANIVIIDYFYGIESDLRKQGATVYAPTLSAVNSTTVRGEQLVSYLKGLAAQRGYTKFNLIGHSQGAIDVRYAAAKVPGLVASVTGIAGPHQGSFPSDAALSGRVADLSVIYKLIGGINNLLNGAILPEDNQAYLVSTSSAGMAQFNAQHPLGLPTTACGEGPEFAGGMYHYSATGIKPMTNLLDPSDYLLGLQSLLTSQRSDGWIEQCSTHYGKVLKDDFAWNHLDEINQVAGLVGWGQDPVAFYRAHAARLKAKGL